jgi:hypothetical protein
MPIRARQFVVVVALALMACGLSSCASINEKLVNGLGDSIPQWAGGLPPDAPPRPGTAKYDAFMQERERKRLEPAPPKDATGQKDETGQVSPQVSSSGLEAVH